MATKLKELPQGIYFYGRYLMIVALAAFVAVFVAGCGAAGQAVGRTGEAVISDAKVWTATMRSDSTKNSYRLTLTTADNTISGLCFAKRYTGEWRGTFMNEMGAKAFDFVVTDDGCKLLNVIALMDKWYVKRTVAADLFFLFAVDSPDAAFASKIKKFEQDGRLVVDYGKRQIVVDQDGTIRLYNKRRRLKYELRKIVEIDMDKII